MKCYCGKEEATKKLPFSLHDGFIPICSKVECKDQILREMDNIKIQDSYQGRSKNPYENSVKINILIFLLCVISCTLIVAYCIFKRSV